MYRTQSFPVCRGQTDLELATQGTTVQNTLHLGDTTSSLATVRSMRDF